MRPKYSESPGARTQNGTPRAVAASSVAGEGAAAARGPVRLCLMLLALHAALAWDIGEWWARAFLLAHFGLFLMWQPVWRSERAVESRHAVLLVIAGVVLAVSNSWWLIAVWLAVLIGLSTHWHPRTVV